MRERDEPQLRGEGFLERTQHYGSNIAFLYESVNGVRTSCVYWKTWDLEASKCYMAALLDHMSPFARMEKHLHSEVDKPCDVPSPHRPALAPLQPPSSVFMIIEIHLFSSTVSAFSCCGNDSNKPRCQEIYLGLLK